MSTTYLGVAVVILAKVLELIGVRLGTEELTQFVNTALVIVGGLVAFYGRFKAGGITWFGAKV